MENQASSDVTPSGVNIEDVNTVTKKVTVSIPAQAVSDRLEQSLSQVSKKVKVKGFRPGKAPRQIVEKLHGDQLRFDVTQELINQTLTDIVREGSYELAAAPDITIEEYKVGEDLKYSANIPLVPKPTISGYDKLEVSVAKREVTEERIAKVVEQIQLTRATVSPLQFRTSVKEGDVLNCQVAVKQVGEESDVTRPEPVSFALGDGTFPKEVEEQLVGLEVGSKKEITYTFPKDHSNEQLREKTFEYVFELLSLSERTLPEVTDEFVKGLNGQAQTVLEMRMQIREDLAARDADEGKADLDAAILEQLVEKNVFEIPQALIDDEIRWMLVDAGAVDPKKVDISRIRVDSFRERLNEPADKRVRARVIVERIGNQENITVSRADRDEYIQKIADTTGVEFSQVKAFFDSPERGPGTDSRIFRDKVLELLRARATVKDTEGQR